MLSLSANLVGRRAGLGGCARGSEVVAKARAHRDAGRRERDALGIDRRDAERGTAAAIVCVRRGDEADGDFQGSQASTQKCSCLQIPPLAAPSPTPTPAPQHRLSQQCAPATTNTANTEPSTAHSWPHPCIAPLRTPTTSPFRPHAARGRPDIPPLAYHAHSIPPVRPSRRQLAGKATLGAAGQGHAAHT